jgi:hypothetical protein
MSTGPKNIVHLSAIDIANDRVKHVTQSEIINIAKAITQFGNISFEESEISSSGVETGTFLSFTIGSTTYKIKLYQ